MREKHGIRDYDWVLLGTRGGDLRAGLIEIYSTTHLTLHRRHAMYVKQFWWLGLGMVCMLVLSRLDYHSIMEQAPIFT